MLSVGCPDFATSVAVDNQNRRRLGAPVKPMLASVFDGRRVTGWLASEKLDGWRAVWDGRVLRSRSGADLRAPAWWTADLPTVPLDGELWMGRGTLRDLQSALATGRWASVRFMVFDSPGPERLEERLERAEASVSGCRFAGFVEQERVAGLDDARVRYATVRAAGGEGLVLRRPGSPYEQKRSHAWLKVRPGEGAEALDSFDV